MPRASRFAWSIYRWGSRPITRCRPPIGFTFCDFAGSYQYKRLEFSVAVNNIFNTTLFTLKTLSAANSYEQQIPLRGRDFLVSLRVKF